MENELYHYGVLGMKWGVRRTPAQLAKANGKAKRKSEDNAKKSDMKKAVKSRRTLSDADLKKRIERIKMEKQLKDLTAEEISPGKKFVSEVLSSSGKKVATALVTGAVLYGTKAALTNQFDIISLLWKPKNTTMAQAAVRSRSIVRVTQSVWMS